MNRLKMEGVLRRKVGKIMRMFSHSFAEGIKCKISRIIKKTYTLITGRQFSFFRFIEICAIIVALYTLKIQLDSFRSSSRIQAWQLLTTKSSGSSGKVEALEYLAKQGVVLDGIDLSCRTHSRGWSNDSEECAYGSPNLNSLNLSKNNIGGHLSMKSSILEEVSLVRSNFEGGILYDTSFRKSDLSFSNFKDCELSGGNFKQSILQGGDFRGAVLEEYLDDDSSYYPDPLPDYGVVFTPGTDFSGADLKWARFGEQDMEGVNFSGAKLGRANFGNSNLSGANFEGSYLEGTDFSHATGLHEGQFQGSWIWDDVSPPKFPKEFNYISRNIEIRNSDYRFGID